MTTRRQFLAATGAGLLASTGVTSPGASDANTQPTGDHQWIGRSQHMPQPPIVFPTDATPPDGPPKRIAAITPAYFKYSHADDIITKFIEGYSIIGRIHNPHCEVVSLYVEQFRDADIGRGMANRYGIPLVRTPTEALTLGGKELAVDGVLLIGEHGRYPRNDKGQTLYPRRRLFAEIVRTFRATGGAVPIFNDKHLSYSWDHAKWMYDQSRELDFPMMAGSSVPVTWRRPALELQIGAPLDGALSVGYAGIESYGFHTLECLQVFTERRVGGESGVRAVQCLQGKATWEAMRQGRWRGDLLEAALANVPTTNGRLMEADGDAIIFLIEYADGFHAASYLSRGHVEEFAFAAQVKGDPSPAGTWYYLPKPQRDHFSFLSNHIEVMFRTGKPSYPVERTLLVSGMLEALIDSHLAGGKRIKTPHLEQIRYQPTA